MVSPLDFQVGYGGVKMILGGLNPLWVETIFRPLVRQADTRCALG